jgi:hypothetical protein
MRPLNTSNVKEIEKLCKVCFKSMPASLLFIIIIIVLRRIFGLKRDEVTGGWRKLHNEELHNLYFSPSIINMIK